MGRIKSLLIKRSAQQLYEGVDVFSDNFEHNKKLLNGDMPSKSTRNKIAGQLVNLAKKEKAKKEKKESHDRARSEQESEGREQAEEVSGRE